MLRGAKALMFALVALTIPVISHAQFVDNFDGPKVEGWFTMTGDGWSKLDLIQKDGHLRMLVDGTNDKYGVYWTLIKRDITRYIDVQKLNDPAYELRVEARIRTSAAPRRVNFMINTNRTTNFHEHLREYYIDTANEWRTISYTTTNFHPAPGDTVYVQFDATDFGPGKYDVDVDYYRADVVRKDTAEPDKGEPLIVHPPVPDIATFSQHLVAAHDSVINLDFPDVNFNDWHAEDQSGPQRVMTVNGNQWIVMRWDFDKYRDKKAAGAGILELTTFSVPLGGKYIEHWGQDLGEEFGMIHVIEILGGDPAWDQEKVTYNNLMRGGKYADVFNEQMIIDLPLAGKPGGKSYYTIPRPVMQRLLEGKTKGLLIRPLGSIDATVYASEDAGGRGPKLHFNVE